jgi:FKBP-type peptidyl-prolyl cis-trans isomerase FkpA
MKRKLMFLALAAIGLASCNGGFKKGAGGLLYDIIKDKGAPRIKEGDFVSLNVIIKNDADSVLLSTYDNGIQSMELLPKSQQKGDVLSAIELLGEGDSAVIKTNIDSLGKGRPRQPGQKGKYTVYIVKIERVISKGNLSDQVFQGRAQAYYTSVVEAVKKANQSAEPGKIKKFIADNKLNVTKTDSGLYYQVTKPGTGIKPIPGDTVVVNYTLKLASGKVLETSIKSDAIKYKMALDPRGYKPMRFAIGTKGMIKGWDQGMQLINKGSQAIFILPSSLAYGAQGGQQVLPYTPLFFYIEMVDVVHPDPNAPKPLSVIPPMQQQRPVKR